MICESFLLRSIAHEGRLWRRREIHTDYVRGFMAGLMDCVRLVRSESARQSAMHPKAPVYLTADDAWALLKHLEMTVNLLRTSDTSKARRKAQAVLDAYKDRQRKARPERAEDAA